MLTLLWQYFIFIDNTCDEFGMSSLNVMSTVLKTQVCGLLSEIIMSDISGQWEIKPISTCQETRYVSYLQLRILLPLICWVFQSQTSHPVFVFSAIAWVCPMWHSGLCPAIVFLLTCFWEAENNFLNTLVMVKRSNIECRMNRVLQQTCFE